MRSAIRVLPLFLAIVMLQPALSAFQADAPNPAREKFQEDMKTAVMNGSITVAQVKELKANADTLKSVRENQTPGAPVDLLDALSCSFQDEGDYDDSRCEGSRDTARGSTSGPGKSAGKGCRGGSKSRTEARQRYFHGGHVWQPDRRPSSAVADESEFSATDQESKPGTTPIASSASRLEIRD